MYNILFIDDDKDFGEIFTELLKENSYVIDYANKAMDGLALEKQKEYDLIILDLYLDKLTGIQMVELIRKHNSDSKIIILTNSAADQDELNGLQIGVDEYLRKNTSFEIMLQRIKSVLKNKTSNVNNSLLLFSKTENISVDTTNKLVKKDEELIRATQLEIDLLSYFLKNKNNLLKREDIFREVWKLAPDEVFISSRTVDVHVKNLRKKLNIKSIHSIRGLGYRWYED